jgi:hypothetical protein
MLCHQTGPAEPFGLSPSLVPHPRFPSEPRRKGARRQWRRRRTRGHGSAAEWRRGRAGRRFFFSFLPTLLFSIGIAQPLLPRSRAVPLLPPRFILLGLLCALFVVKHSVDFLAYMYCVISMTLLPVIVQPSEFVYSFTHQHYNFQLFTTTRVMVNCIDSFFYLVVEFLSFCLAKK